MRRVVVVVLRTMCVYLALQVVFHLPMTAIAWRLNGPLAELQSMPAIMLIYRIVGLLGLLLVVFKADRIACWVVREDITIESVPVELLNQTLLRVGVLTVGFAQIISHIHLLLVSLIAQATSGTENAALQEAYYAEHGRGGLIHFYWFSYNDEIVAHAVWLVLGILVCVFNLPLSRMLQRIFIRRSGSTASTT